jgi:tRNA (mo5U34)-methyltransferase
MNLDELRTRIDKLGPWFHYIDLGHGVVTKKTSAVGEPLEHPRPTWEKVRVAIPEDLAGKTLLDVGCNAGFYAIEASRRGAVRVLGIDSQRNLIRQAVFVRDVLGLDIEYRRLTVYDLDPRELGQFDITLALGLVYHCKHLVLALERLFAITRELLILETAIYPRNVAPQSSTYKVGELTSHLHPIAYVENPSDAKEAIYNWFLPSVEALRALVKNVGFDKVEVLPSSDGDRVILACRKSEPYPDSRAIAYLSAGISLIDGPQKCSPGEVLSFRIRTENTGYARWLMKGEEKKDRGAVHLVAHILSPDEEPLSWYHAGAFLPHDVAPGEAVEIQIVLRAPEKREDYLLEFDMISEHIAWFEDLGSKVLRVGISVV